jgi:hypothetical protein
LNEFHAADLPAFQEWSQNFQPPADVGAYLGEHLSVTTASLFTELLFPHMVLVRNCVILASRYEPENFERWWASTGGDHNAVERALNHIHLWDIFEPNGDPEERALEELASRVAETWCLQAQRLFPDRRFVGEVTDEYGPTVVLTTQVNSPQAGTQ